MHAMVVAVIAECLLCSAKIGSGTNRPRCGTLTDPWHDRGVIALARIVLRLFVDLADLVVPSATPLTRRRIGERLGGARLVVAGWRASRIPAGARVGVTG